MRISFELERDNDQELIVDEYLVDSYSIGKEERNNFLSVSAKDTNISYFGDNPEHYNRADELKLPENMKSEDIDIVNNNLDKHKIKINDLESETPDESPSNMSAIGESLEKSDYYSDEKIDKVEAEIGKEEDGPEDKKRCETEGEEQEEEYNGGDESGGDLNKLEGSNSDSSNQGAGDEEEHTGSIALPESTLPYKLWIDAKSRDWILEWQTKNGRWSVRKFSCKRWGKGKAYSHAMNFLASLTSCGIIKDSSEYSKQLLNGIVPSQESLEASNRSIRSVEDELVLQFLSQREAAAAGGIGGTNGSVIDKQKGFSSGSSLNTLAAIAAAAAIASTPDKQPQTGIKEQYSHSPNGTTYSTLNASNAGGQPQTRGAVRKSGVPGVYWSQKPQGWRVVYYTGKDREFEYFKVPANASEEIISEILEVAKRFRSQVTAEGRHLPNGAMGSSSKRARMAERKAAAAAAAATAANVSSNISRRLNGNNGGITDFKSGVNLSLSPPETRNNSRSMLDGDPLAQFTSSFACPTGIPGLTPQTNPLIPNPYDWFYNPLFLSLYGNYTAASQAAAIQQWALLQNSGNILGAGTGGPECGGNQSMLNSFFQAPNSLMNPFNFQMQPVVGNSQGPTNGGLMQQVPQMPSINQAATATAAAAAAAAASQMGMNMLGRYYGMVLPPQTTNTAQSNPATQANCAQFNNASANGNVIGTNVSSNLTNPPIPLSFPVQNATQDMSAPLFNQFPTLQKVNSDTEPPPVQKTMGKDKTMPPDGVSNSSDLDIKTHISVISAQGEENENLLVDSEAPIKQMETRMLEISSGSNNSSE